MREVRTFEMEYQEPPVLWQVAEPLVVTVMAGQLWLTMELDAEDVWLEKGQSFVVPAAARAWISAGQGGARVTVSSAGRAAMTRSASRHGMRAWMPRWLRPA
jgi:quercetin dioxygenase-like cupin family protein